MSIKEGWMTKQGGMIKTWKKRWFSIQGTALLYSEKPGKKENGSIPLDQATEIGMAPECKKAHAWKIDVPGERTFIICADSDQSAREWIDACIKIRDSAKKGVTPSPSPAAGPAAPANKVKLEDFDILRVIGKGTYGKVQLVRSKKDKQLYAMKTMSKRLLEESEQIQQTLTEKSVLLQTVHPFLVGAHFTFQTPQKIFMILDYVPGGELFGRLKEEGKFSETRVQLYAAEIMLGLGHLHSQGFVYRDLKPENILVDAQGHLKITDFGLIKKNMNDPHATTTTFCGTPEYIAPEMLQQQPYTKAVDWWSFGILVYEMLTGLPPFYDENTNKMYRMILSDPITFPSYVSREAQQLITKLLDRNPESRLGAGPGDVEEIKAEPFFRSLNWEDVLAKKTHPEWVPVITNATDTSNFDEEFTQEEAAVSFEDASLIDSQTQQDFEGFTCTADSALDGLG